MRKNKKSLFILFSIVIILAYIISTKPIGICRDNIKSKKTSVSTFGFNAKENETLRFVFNSKVIEGDLEFQIIDSNKQIIYNFPINGNGKEVITIKYNDNYTLNVNYSNFIGNFNIKAYK